MSSNKKLRKLEALRGAAAFYVMLGHTFSDKFTVAGKDLSVLLSFGQEAVILFFMLSGFVIQYSFTRSNDKSFELYFLKRFLRIYIPLIIVFICNYLIFCFYEGRFFSPDGYNLLGNLLMLQDASSLKPNVICSYFLGNSPLWSLSYEWWFYMIFFFIYTKRKEQSSRIVYVAGIAAAISYIIYPNFVNRIFMYLTIWWVGADIAKLYIQGLRINLKNLFLPVCCLLIQVVILGINVYVNKNTLAVELGHSSIGMSPYLELRHFSFALIALLGSLAWYHIGWKGFSYTIGIFEPFANISFGVYISHWFLVARAKYLDGVIDNPVIKYVIYFLICFAFSFIVERKIYPALSRKVISSFHQRFPRKVKERLA